MKEYTITLTESEIEAIRIALSDDSLYYLARVNYLNEHNKTGLNTELIEKIRDAAHRFSAVNAKLVDVQR